MKMKRMPGLLCRSEASTAVCIPSNPRPLTLPRRPCRSTIHLNHHHYPSSRTRYYSRLVDDLDVQKRLHHTPLAASSKREKTKKAITALVDQNLPPPIAPSTLGDVFQVVVMRVSIHCQGCAGKVKKHISKMEGVTSFSIDLETKRVTVMGHISPDGVLESISKVKKAEFWYA